MLDGAEITFTALETGDRAPPGWTRFWFLPKELAEREDGGLCEVCGKPDEIDIYLTKGKTSELCQEHAGLGALKLDIKPVLVPTFSLPSSEGEPDDRQVVHKLMRQLETKRLTRREISAELTRLGYQEVSERTVAKHLRAECACFEADQA